MGERGDEEAFEIERPLMNTPEEDTTAKILYVGTSGSDDPTRAGLPFNFALGAVDAGHQPEIFLAGEAAYLMKATVMDAVMPHMPLSHRRQPRTQHKTGAAGAAGDELYVLRARP